MVIHDDLTQMFLAEVQKDGMALAKIPHKLRTLELCVAALKQCQNPKCFALIPKHIRTRAKIAAGCYSYHASIGSFISSIYRKG
ncbi:DUF4116 domain-containing protein [Breznakiellaceae bacterium SP9]